MRTEKQLQKGVRGWMRHGVIYTGTVSYTRHPFIIGPRGFASVLGVAGQEVFNTYAVHDQYYGPGDPRGRLEAAIAVWLTFDEAVAICASGKKP